MGRCPGQGFTTWENFQMCLLFGIGFFLLSEILGLFMYFDLGTDPIASFVIIPTITYVLGVVFLWIMTETAP